MNCQRTQQEITESFAAGTPVLSDALSEHVEVCEECRRFYRSERELFALLGRELNSLANPPVPPSLLPGLRARLEAEQSPSSF